MVQCIVVDILISLKKGEASTVFEHENLVTFHNLRA